MTQAVLPIFLARTEGSSGLSGAGDIINVGSIAGREPYPGGSIYCATKAAVRSFTESLRKELISTRVRVIEIDPGQVETEFSVVRFYGDKKAADKVYEGCEPLTPDDIAEVVVFAAGRRENVVVADTLIYPNHQVCLDFHFVHFHPCSLPCLFALQLLISERPLPRSCTERLETRDATMNDVSDWRYTGWCWRKQLVQASSLTKDLDVNVEVLECGEIERPHHEFHVLSLPTFASIISAFKCVSSKQQDACPWIQLSHMNDV